MQLPQRQDLVSQGGNPIVDQPDQTEIIDAEALLAVVKRQWRVFSVCVFAALLLGVGYIMTAVPLYTASVRVLIDSDSSKLIEQLAAMGGIADDEGAILSQVEIIESSSISLAVVDKLNLLEDPVFNANNSSLVSQVVGVVRAVVNVSRWFSSEEPTEVERERARYLAASRLVRDIDVSRVGRSYVLSISYTSPSPDFSARVANAYASEYMLDKLNAKYDATRRAGEWLNARISELRQKALETDLAVQKFRSENGLIQTNQSGNGGALVTDQQLYQLNNELITARADTAKATARLQRIQQILSSDEMDAVVPDILESPIANELRKKYLESSKTEAEISARLGNNHVQAVRLRNEMQEYKRLMFSELKRIAESYKSDRDVAEAREKSIEASVNQASNASASASETQVQLRELEREADSYRTLYQNFLQRYQESVQQQTFPVTDARIISSAEPPERPSKPSKAVALAVFFVLGGLVGSGIGAFREFRDRFFRTGDQIRDVLGQEFLGNIFIADAKPAKPPVVPEGFDPSRCITRSSGLSEYVLHYPMSAIAETLRATRLAIDLSVTGKPSRVIGIVSTLPGEGKSTVAANLAELLASQGARTLLVDADIRNPGATRALGRYAKFGLLEVLMGSRDYRDVLLVNPATGLAFLPAVLKQRVPHSSELLMSSAMRKLLADLSAQYDYVIIDLPPIGPVIDARAISERLDGFVYVVEWGNTARRVVRSTLDHEPSIRNKCIGVVMNKVDQEKLKLYRAYGSGEYYYSRYENYYHHEAS